MTIPLTVQIRRLPSADGLALPLYMTPGAAGMDLHAAVEDDVVIDPGAIVLVPTGLEVAIPGGFEGQVRPRSGLARKFGITLPNAPGTIDSDYRGEVQVLLANLGTEAYLVNPGDRVAQLVIAPVVTAELEEADSLEDSARGDGGFGHTGR